MTDAIPAGTGPVLITGAAGLVGELLVSGLRGQFPLRLTDRRPGPEIVVGDLREPAFAAEVAAGVAAIVHLAADPDPDRDWADLRGPNADVVVNVLDAARTAGVGTVVYASSLHAMGGHLDAVRTQARERAPSPAAIHADLPPRPCCTYGAVKVLGESLGRVWADRFGLSVRCLRLGGVRAEPVARSWLGGWLSPGDLVRLVSAALTADVPYGVYHGISANTGTAWSIDSARAELGYEPQDDSAIYAGKVPDDLKHTPPDPRLAHRS